MTTTAHTKDDAVRQLAHKMWEDDGRPEGRSEEFWFKAQQALDTVPVMKPATVAKAAIKKGKSAKR